MLANTMPRVLGIKEPGTQLSSGVSPKIVEKKPEPLTRIQAELEKRATEDELGRDGVPFVLGPYFSTFVCIMVLLNTLLMGIEADYPDWGLWVYTESFFTAAFLFEMVLKLCCLRAEYFRDKGNWLDASVAVLAAVDNWCLALFGLGLDLKVLTILRVLRLSRLVRILRLAEAFKHLVLVIAGVVDAVRTTCWVAGVLGLAIYVCSIFCVGYLGKSTKDLYPGYTEEVVEMDEFEIMQYYNPYASFGTMPRSMLTLFNIAIMAEWTEVVRPVFEKQPVLVVFMILFVQFITFGLMNVIVGMIVDNVVSNKQKMQVMSCCKEAQRGLELFEDIRNLSQSEVDLNNDGFISREGLAASMERGHFKDLLEQVNLPQGCSTQELYYLLDQQGEGRMKSEEFLEGFYRLLQNDEFQSKLMFQIGINHCKSLIKELHKETKEQCEAMHAMCQAQFLDLRCLMLDMQRQVSETAGLRRQAERKMQMADELQTERKMQMADELQKCSPKRQPKSLGQGKKGTEADGKAEESDVFSSLIKTLSVPVNNHYASISQSAPILPDVLQEGFDDMVPNEPSDVRSAGGVTRADRTTGNDMRLPCCPHEWGCEASSSAFRRR